MSAKIVMMCNKIPEFAEERPSSFIRSKICYDVKDGKLFQVTLSVAVCGDIIGEVQRRDREITDEGELRIILENYPQLSDALRKYKSE